MASPTKPQFCSWCGARLSEWGHDDDCPRPEPASRETARAVIAGYTLEELAEKGIV